MQTFVPGVGHVFRNNQRTNLLFAAVLSQRTMMLEAPPALPDRLFRNYPMPNRCRRVESQSLGIVIGLCQNMTTLLAGAYLSKFPTEPLECAMKNGRHLQSAISSFLLWDSA